MLIQLPNKAHVQFSTKLEVDQTADIVDQKLHKKLAHQLISREASVTQPLFFYI